MTSTMAVFEDDECARFKNFTFFSDTMKSITDSIRVNQTMFLPEKQPVRKRQIPFSGGDEKQSSQTYNHTWICTFILLTFFCGKILSLPLANMAVVIPN